MNRIEQLFTTKRRDILSVYFTAGYPERDSTVEILRELEAQGVDMAEVGIPFSDPLADGPVIQASSQQALRNGMSLHRLFEQLQLIRQEIRMPLILMGYLNPILQFGFPAFCQACRSCGIDGVIIPDLPFREYLQEYKAIAEGAGLRMILLVTPETSDERIRRIDAETDGFIYIVSSAATTGTQRQFGEERLAYFRHIRGMRLKNPTLIGFGISNRSTLEAARQNAEGAIVGSRFIELLGHTASPKEAVTRLLRDLSEE